MSEAQLTEDLLCLWYEAPARLRALFVLTLTEGSASPVPMDCLRICSDLWTPELRDCILRGRGRIDDTVILEVVQLCPDLSSLDVCDVRVLGTLIYH